MTNKTLVLVINPYSPNFKRYWMTLHDRAGQWVMNPVNAREYTSERAANTAWVAVKKKFPDLHIAVETHPRWEEVHI